ncbi:MAG: class B sortase [Eubacterium sp.]|nr:class B sortase [Eubacterium sp.]
MSEEFKQVNSEDDERRQGRGILIFLGIILILAASVYLGFYLYNQYTARQSDEVISSVAATTETTEQKAENPIDFASLQKQNDDIYAWIKVPGTKVDYPVVCHPEDDSFYLKHDAYTKKWLSSGAVYTELGNSIAFDDSVTVVYGHNGYGDTMFTTLHKFEEKEFFDKHSEFYIYMPGRKLTYNIVSAFKFDDRHILNCFQLNDTAVLASFLSMLQSPETNNKNVRESFGRRLNNDDKIVILSTCFSNQKSNRYLVCGVLIEDEKTN